MPAPNWSRVEHMSTEKIELGIECGHHPELLSKLHAMHADTFETRLACVAAYCEVAVDGDYMPAEIDKLCDILTHKLRQMRHLILMPTPARLQ